MKYAEEIALSRLWHGYNPDELFFLVGHFCTAPLAVIDQGGSKHHVIINHSYPKNKHCIDLGSLPCDTTQKYIIDPTETSINTIIDLKRFQYVWGSFPECYLLVADAPKGTRWFHLHMLPLLPPIWWFSWIHLLFDTCMEHHRRIGMAMGTWKICGLFNGIHVHQFLVGSICEEGGASWEEERQMPGADLNLDSWLISHYERSWECDRHPEPCLSHHTRRAVMVGLTVQILRQIQGQPFRQSEA